MNSAADAFRRAAARGGPLFKTYALFRACLDAKGRIDPGLFDWIDNAPGSLRWRDVDKDKGSVLMGEGDGVLTIWGDLPTIPDAVQDSAGAWYVVESGLERDSLGAGLRLAVRRWKDPALPRIRAGAP